MQSLVLLILDLCRLHLAEVLNKVYILLTYLTAHYVCDREYARGTLYLLWLAVATTARRDRVSDTSQTYL
jgi:hypothetical protein